ncbi:MAG: tetratricopeptide repeat protein [Chlamydiales bacterium]|nr:tetratricopeptide repeat protein [Chlamydiales bacterium]
MRNRGLFFLLGIIICSGVFAEGKSTSIEERVALKKIIEYWKEEEFSTAESQITAFFNKHPDSAYADTLLSMLGDLHFYKNNYSQSLQAYQKIQAETFLNQTAFNRLYCLYKLEQFSDAVACAEHFLSRQDRQLEKENIVLFLMGDSLFRSGKKEEDLSQKSQCYERAAGCFEQLIKSDFKEQTLPPLLEIYTDLKEWKKGVGVLNALASLHPQEKEGFLFRVAAMQLHYDRKESVETYRTIYLLKGPHASLAACNRIRLLFEQKRYKELLLSYEESLKYISLEDLNTVRYYIGSCLVVLKDYRLALAHLSQFIEAKGQNPLFLKSAYHSLALCAKELGDCKAFDRNLNRLTEQFPRSEEMASVLLMDIRLSKESKQFERAEKSLSMLIEQFPSHPDLEALLYEKGVLLLRMQKWGLAVCAFDRFLDAYPLSEKKPQALFRIIYCKKEEIAQALPESAQARRQDLMEILAVSLGEKDLFKEEEEKKLRLLLGKTLYELGKYAEAIDQFDAYLTKFSNDPSYAHVYDMLALCFERENKTVAFIECAEKACAASEASHLLETSKSGLATLHLKLYNAYLSLVQEAEEEKKLEYLELAAEHLFSSLDRVKKENCKWLASYYSQRFQEKGEETDLTRAIISLEHLLKLQGSVPLEMETESIKLSALYADAGRFSDAIVLLCNLNKEYESSPEEDWKYRRLALFKLGQVYEKIGDAAEACRVYDDLIQTAAHSHSYFGLAASLHKVKLEYKLLEEDADEEMLQDIFDRLKDLEVRRKLATEPWHLEAALTYIDLRVELAEEGEREALFSQLLSRMEENFSSEKYLAPQDQLPKQLAVYDQYMQFLNTEKLRLRALAAESPLKEELLKEVQENYCSLQEERGHELLKIRIAKRLEE